MVWWLLRQHDLVALLPRNLVLPLLQSGELIELPLGYDVALKPIGALQPQSGVGAATMLLVNFMKQLAMPAPNTNPA